MTIQRKITTAIATGAVLAQVLSPIALADTQILDNGALSTNVVNTSVSNTSVVTQNNAASISNVVSSNSSTGGNKADFNTNGNNTIVTGAATNVTHIDNNANLNQATVAPCGACGANAGDVKISGNGAASHNTVNQAVNANHNSADVTVVQNNVANVSNGVSANANTGNNSGSFNTGGNTVIATGPAYTEVSVNNNLNQNRALVGGAMAGVGAVTDPSLIINGNGALSTNVINSVRDSAVVLTQNNLASVANVVASNANTGSNTGDFNTGGSTMIVTGMAQAKTIVDNAVNLNIANVDCSCLLGGASDVKIAGNGASGLNVVNDNHDSVVFATQLSAAELLNGVGSNAATGSNSSVFGTGHTDSDPAILTGPATDMTIVSTTSNANLYGTSSLPSALALSFDLSPIFGLLWW